MMRQANAARALLARIQAARRKREADAGACNQDAWTEHAVARQMAEAIGEAAPQPPPSAPTGLTAAGGPARVSLAWNAVPSASYNVKRSTQNGGPYSTIASLLASPSYEDSNVTPGTTYYYVVSASNSGGESPNSSQASATPTTLSSGTGLTGNYFNNITLTAPAALTLGPYRTP